MVRARAIKQVEAAIGKKYVAKKVKSKIDSKVLQRRIATQLKIAKNNMQKEIIQETRFKNAADVEEETDIFFGNATGCNKVVLNYQFVTLQYDEIKKDMNVLVVAKGKPKFEQCYSQTSCLTDDYQKFKIIQMRVVKKDPFFLELEETSKDKEFPIKTLHTFYYDVKTLRLCGEYMNVKICDASYKMSVNQSDFKIINEGKVCVQE